MTSTKPGSRWRRLSQRDRIQSRTEQLPVSSRWLYIVDHYSSLPAMALLVAIMLIVSIAIGAVLRFSQAWITTFEVGASAITLMMVLVIQHTQGREQAATQRKLDELLRAVPDARSGLMLLEEAPDTTMRRVEREQRVARQVESPGLPGPPAADNSAASA